MRTVFPIYKRLFIFFKERFPLHIYIPFVIFLYLSMSFTVQAIQSNRVVIDTYTYVGLASSLLFMLLIRVFDDIKDFELDKKIFPNRPATRGDVLKPDLYLITIVTFVILVLINFGFATKTRYIFSFVLIYALLTYKWFFIKKLHLKYVFLTMLTHQPLPYLINFYLMHTALASGAKYEHFTQSHFALLLLFTIPITIWETSRKIRSKKKEDRYQTFSKILGASNATFIPLTAVLITTVLNYYAGALLHFGLSFYIIVTFAAIYAGIFYIRFIMSPTESHNNLKTTASVFTGLISLNLFIHIFLAINITVS